MFFLASVNSFFDDFWFSISSFCNAINGSNSASKSGSSLSLLYFCDSAFAAFIDLTFSDIALASSSGIATTCTLSENVSAAAGSML